jgi:hypothetical protein
MGENTMRIQRHKKAIIGTGLALMLIMSASLIWAQEFFPRKWDSRKVNLSFNHYYDWEEMEQALRTLEKAYPKFLKLNTAGKSWLGRELWYMTINNPDTGDELSKCAMYIDANIHGNEVQGGEIGLYTIWYLMENYNFNDGIKQLVDERVFYIFPSVNPDGRDMWLHKGASARTGQVPLDDDNDGLYDEDGAEDLDGDGEVGSMFIKVEPGKGTHRMMRSATTSMSVRKGWTTTGTAATTKTRAAGMTPTGTGEPTGSPDTSSAVPATTPSTGLNPRPPVTSSTRTPTSPAFRPFTTPAA